jgi:hypothetical protein
MPVVLGKGQQDVKGGGRKGQQVGDVGISSHSGYIITG